MSELPAGLTSLEPIPYGETRWNGAVWPNVQVDRYNSELSRIASRHNAGMDTQNLVDGLYNLASGFDRAGRLEKLREAIDSESISYGEIAELQGLAEHIEPEDVQLLEWAGVPEFPENS